MFILYIKRQMIVIFQEAVAKVSEHVHQLEKFDGLVPIFINANTGLFRESATIDHSWRTR